METVRVQFREDDLATLRQEVDEGTYPNLSEAIRDKVRKSSLLEAIVHMHEATDGMDHDEALAALEETRARTMPSMQRILDDRSTLFSGRMGRAGPVGAFVPLTGC